MVIHRFGKIFFFVTLIAFLPAIVSAQSSEELLLEFIDRFESLREFDVEIDAEIESKVVPTESSSDNWLRNCTIRYAKSEKIAKPEERAKPNRKAYLRVETTSLTDESVSDEAYELLEIDGKQWLNTNMGKTIEGDEKSKYGDLPFSPKSLVRVRPFELWAVVLNGEDAFDREASDISIDNALSIERVLDESTTEDGSRILVQEKNKMFVYELFFDRKFGGMPSKVAMFRYHGKINLKNPSANTSPFYESAIEWIKSDKGWLISGLTVVSLNGPPQRTLKTRFVSKWTWAEKLDDSLFSPPQTKT